MVVLQETVEMAQNVERLKIEFLKQMQSEEERMQEEIQALQKKYQNEHHDSDVSSRKRRQNHARAAPLAEQRFN